MYGFDSNTLKYLLLKLKSKFATKSEIDNKVDKVPGKQLSTNDFTDTFKAKTERIFDTVSVNYDDVSYDYELTFTRANKDSEKVLIPCNKKKPLGLVSDLDDAIIFNANKVNTLKFKMTSSIMYKDYSYRLRVYAVDKSNAKNLIHSKTYSNNYFNDLNGELRSALDEITYDYTPDTSHTKLIIDFRRLNNNNTSDYVDSQKIVIDVIVKYIIAIYTFKSGFDMLPTMDANSDFTYACKDTYNENGTVTRTLYTDKNNLPITISFKNKDGLVSIDYFDQASNTISIDGTFEGCADLVSGASNINETVGYLYNTYRDCTNLVFPGGRLHPNIRSMDNAYRNCISLTETLQERDASYFSTITMDNTYAGCRSLTDGYVTGSNLVLTNTFADCPNLRNVYINTYNGKAISAQSMFANKNNSTRLNIYMTDHTYGSFDAFLVNNSNSIVGKDITWTTSISDFGGTMYYNNAYNIYIHSVDDVSFHRDLKEGKVIAYGDLGAGLKIINNLKHKPIYVNGLNVYNCKAYYKTNIQDCPTRVERDSANRNIYNVYLSNDITNLYKSFYDSNVYRVHSSADITNMALAFTYCNRAVNLPRSGNNTTTLRSAYEECRNLLDAPTCGPNVVCMDCAYYNCVNLTGQPVCGPNVTAMNRAYYNCINLTGNAACGPNVVCMDSAYVGCTNLNGSPACGDSVEYMPYAYYNCISLTGSPVCGPNVTNMAWAYHNCTNLTGSPVCGPNVTDMSYAYYNCTNLNNTKAIMIGESVKSLYGAFYSSSISNGCCNIYVKSRDVFNFRALSAIEATYGQQINFFVPTGTRTHNACILGKLSELNSFDVTDYTINDDYVTKKYVNEFYAITAYACHDVDKMYKMNELQILSYTAAGSVVPIINYSNFTTETINDRNYLFKNNIDEEISHIDFSDESSLTDINIHIKDVDSLYRSFYNCNELTSVSYYGRSTTNMKEAYYNCSNIKNSPSYGPNVVDMSSAFDNCTNLTGYATVGKNAVNLYRTFYGCKNLKSNAYIFSKSVQNAKECFGGRTSLKRLNLYVPDNSITRATVLSQTITSVLGFDISYTYDSLNNFYYNTIQNIYIYPVDNVEQTRLDNDGLITYLSHNDGATLPNVVNSYYADEIFYNDPYRITTLLLAEENTGNLSSSINMSNTKVINVLGLSKRVVNLSGSFKNSTTLKSFDANACHVINATSTFRACQNLTTVVNLSNAISMYYTYSECYNLTGQPTCGDYVTDMDYAYQNCRNLIGKPVCGPNVMSMVYAYSGCSNLMGEAACGSNVVNFMGAYQGCNITTAACGDKVNCMVATYSGCNNLTTAACGPNVKDMYWCYYSCRNLREAACGPNVVNLSGAYIDCDNLTTAVCGDKVKDMKQSYQSCNNLTTAACGPNVTEMSYAYAYCNNLTTAVCGDKVTDMRSAYADCYNLKNAYIGPNVSYTTNAFSNCANISNIVFANGLKYINTNTFTNLTKAIDVCFPSSILEIETNAFYNCKNITSYDFSAHTSKLPSLETNALGAINYNFSIYIQSGLYDTWSSGSTWEKYNDKIIPLSDQATIIDNGEDNYILSFDHDSECVLKCIKFNEEDMGNIEVSISSEADNIISISYDYEIINEHVTNLIIVLSNCGVATEEFTFDIYINAGDFSFTKTITAIVYEVIPFSYEVLPVEGAAYGFELNANGYYESKNKGKDNSYALCKLVLNNLAGKTVYLDCINYAESSYDFGLISKVDTPLTLSNTADSGVLHSFKGKQSASIQSVSLGTQSGTFYIKFRKDSSVNANNDSLQFKVRVED